MDELILETQVVTDKISFKDIRAEIKEIKNAVEPTRDELVQLGKTIHPYYLNKDKLPGLRAILKQYNEVE